jgi:hypothetical protein
MNIETAVVIAIWNDQTGEWWAIEDAPNPVAARERVAALKENDLDEEFTGFTHRRYQIVTTITEEV